jgi:hypothetical protein
MTDKFTKNLDTSVFHVMQTVICITEDLWKVIGLVWFSLVQFGSHSFSFLPIQCFKSLQNVKVHIAGYSVNIFCSDYGLLGCNTMSSCLMQPTF